MFFKRRKSLVWLLALFFLLAQIIASPIFAQSTGTDRISGADRYKTAVAVSQKGWKTSDYAVLARGDSFADALCAGPLSQKYGGPILLTPPNQLNSDTLNELKRLGVKHLFIAGGVGAVSQSVENSLKANGIGTIERIYGTDRYETSVKIAEKVGDSTKVVLATGSDFPDALSISGIAAKLGMPILLTAKNSLPSGVRNYLQTNTVTQTYVVGGTGVISSEVADSVPGPARLAGSDRYETNKVIMQNFASELNFENIYVAVGTQFADALTGAVLAAKSSAPLVLTGKNLPTDTADYLQTKLKLSTKVKGLGGKLAVPSSILEGLVASKEQIAVEEKYSTAGTYGPETGTKTIQGSVIISSADVTLRNTIIEGDLLLGRSIGDGDVSLRDVTVKGKTIINGGGPNSIIMYNFNGQTVVVDVPDGANVRLVAQGSTSVDNVSMEGSGTLDQSEVTGTGFVTVEIPAGAQVTLSGDFNEVNVEAAGANVTVTSGNITTMNISESASGSGVNLASGSSVGTLNANAESNVTGQGQITTANINVNGVTIEQKPSNTTLGNDVDSSNVGGEEIDESITQPDYSDDPVAVSNVTVTPTSMTLVAAETGTLQANIGPSHASNKGVTWSSSNESVATVADGVVTAVAQGTAIITATTTDGNKTATSTVTVAQKINNQAELTTALADATIPAMKLFGEFSGFQVNRSVIIAGGTITTQSFDGHGEKVGIWAYANDIQVVIEDVTITGDDSGRGIEMTGRVDLTVKDSSISDVLSGIYVNPGAKLTASGNTIANTVAGIGTESADLTGTISDNTFTNSTEAIGLQTPINLDGSPMVEAEAEDLADALRTANNLTAGTAPDVNLYGPFPTGTVKRYNSAGVYQEIYGSIQEAIDAVYEFEDPGVLTTYIIKVMSGTYDDDIEIIQDGNKNIVLQPVTDNTVTLKGTIAVNGAGALGREESLTIKGIVFDFSAETENTDIISTQEVSGITYNYSHNIFIDDCEFIGNAETLGVVAVRAGASGGHRNYKIINSTGTNLHSLGQFTSVDTVTIENVTVSGGDSGLNLNNSTSINITGFDFEGTGYGVRVGQGSGTPTDNTLSITDSSLVGTSQCTDISDPDTALVLRGDAARNIIISDSTIMNSNNGSYDIANKNSANSEYYNFTFTNVSWGDDGMLLGGFGEVGLLRADEGSISYYETIQDAIDLAEDDDTILVVDGTYNLTAQLVLDKAITIQGTDATNKPVLNLKAVTSSNQGSIHVKSAATLLNLKLVGEEGTYKGQNSLISFGDSVPSSMGLATVDNCELIVAAGNTSTTVSRAIEIWTNAGRDVTISDCVISGGEAGNPYGMIYATVSAGTTFTLTGNNVSGYAYGNLGIDNYGAVVVTGNTFDSTNSSTENVGYSGSGTVTKGNNVFIGEKDVATELADSM